MHTNLVAADAAAVRETVRLVSTVTDLSLPTPCAGWDLGALLAHMTAQHHGFAAAAEGRGSDPAVWHAAAAADPVRGHAASADPVRGNAASADPVRRYAASAGLVIAAFAAPGVLERDFALPEISTAQTFPGRMAVAFHLVDYVAHGWDVARALGLPYTPGDELAAAALPIARAVPTGPSRSVPGAAFAPALGVPAGADALTETLLLLGRDPAWTPAHATARHT